MHCQTPAPGASSAPQPPAHPAHPTPPARAGKGKKPECYEFKCDSAREASEWLWALQWALSEPTRREAAMKQKSMHAEKSQDHPMVSDLPL